MRLTLANEKAKDNACKHWHYSKSHPLKTIGYNVFNANDEWCGVVLFGLGAMHHIGDSYNLPMGGVVELVRVALNGKQEATSQAVAMSLKQLKKDAPVVRLVVSYADIDQSHLGTIYQATNWIYTGETAAGTPSFIIHGKKTHKRSIYDHIVIIDGKPMHCPENLENVRRFIDPKAQVVYSAGKRKYLFPLDKAMRRKILPLSKPYPKNEDWAKIDRSIFKDKETINQGEKVAQT